MRPPARLSLRRGARSALRTVLVVALFGVAALPVRAQAPSDSAYTVRDGDTLYSIARQHGVSVRALKQWNDLADTSIEVGQVLRVQPPRPARASTDSTYTVQTGDTLFQIARRFDVPIASLQRWNGLDAASIQPGQTLQVTPPPDASARATPPPDTLATPPALVDTAASGPPVYGRYVAASGDTWINLALRTGTTVDTLLALNDDATADTLAPGQTVRLPKRFAPPAHTVGPDETLYTIAGAYGLSVRALREANNLDTVAVAPGQRLRLPGRSAPSVPETRLAPPDTTGPVAVYPPTFAGRLMTSGAPYDPDALVGSHPSLPYGSLVHLSRPGTDRRALVRIADRGPLDEDMLMDISAAAARELGLDDTTGGNQRVALRVVWVRDE